MEIKSGAMEELGINGEDIFDNTEKFVKDCLAACRDLARQLDSNTTQNDIVTSYKKVAQENKEAAEKAEEIYDSMVSMISDLDPAIVACLLPKLSELGQYGNNIVTTVAMRDAGITHVSKRVLHAQYRSVKDGYETAMDMLRAFFPEKVSQWQKGRDYYFPTIPAKHGNYRDRDGIQMYKFAIDGVEYFHPFKVAKKLGIEAMTYMDVIEAIKKNPGKYPNVELVEF